MVEEFKNKFKKSDKNDISYDLWCPRIPQLNEFVERKNIYIQNMAKTFTNYKMFLNTYGL